MQQALPSRTESVVGIGRTKALVESFGWVYRAHFGLVHQEDNRTSRCPPKRDLGVADGNGRGSESAVPKPSRPRALAGERQ